MEIKDVKLQTLSKKESGGLHVDPYLLVEYTDGKVLSVPLDPRNKDYMDAADWYDAQKKKPFKFTFERITLDLTEGAEPFEPAPLMETTEPEPEISTKINLTKTQRREITQAEQKRQATIARRLGTAEES